MNHHHATVGVYHSHKEAAAAVNELKEAGFPVENISIVGKGKLVEDHLHPHDAGEVFNESVAIGGILGSFLGVLTGLSLAVVPGLGVLYMGGAIVGAFGGLSLGSTAGGVVGFLLSLGIGKEGVMTYHQHLAIGKYLVVCHGNKAQVKNAKEILHNTEHAALAVHE